MGEGPQTSEKISSRGVGSFDRGHRERKFMTFIDMTRITMEILIV